MIDWIDWNTALTSIVSVGGGVAATLLALRRRLSHDNTVIAVDDAKQDFVVMLQRERDQAMNDAREAVDQRTLLASEVARLRELLTASNKERVRQSLEFSSFRRLVLRLHPDMEEFLISDYGALTDPPPPRQGF